MHYVSQWSGRTCQIRHKTNSNLYVTYKKHTSSIKIQINIKVIWYKYIYNDNPNQKKAGMAILKLEEVDFWEKYTCW